MSIGLVLWKAPVVSEPEAAEALLRPWYEREDDGAFERSEDIARCADELRRHYPEDPSLYPPDEPSPWAERPFRQSERLLLLSLRPDAGEEVLDEVADLAFEHGLVLYDPRGPYLFLPDELEEPGQPPGPADWVRFTLFALGSAGMLVLGQRLEVPVLDKVLTAFGGFLTAVVLFILIMYLVRGERKR